MTALQYRLRELLASSRIVTHYEPTGCLDAPSHIPTGATVRLTEWPAVRVLGNRPGDEALRFMQAAYDNAYGNQKELGHAD